MQYHVYVLKDEAGRFYTGLTNNVERRLKEHNAKQHKTTKHGKNWELVFSQVCADRAEARQFEKHLKSGSFRQFRKSLLV